MHPGVADLYFPSFFNSILSERFGQRLPISSLEQVSKYTRERKLLCVEREFWKSYGRPIMCRKQHEKKKKRKKEQIAVRLI